MSALRPRCILYRLAETADFKLSSNRLLRAQIAPDKGLDFESVNLGKNFANFFASNLKLVNASIVFV